MKKEMIIGGIVAALLGLVLEYFILFKPFVFDRFLDSHIIWNILLFIPIMIGAFLSIIPGFYAIHMMGGSEVSQELLIQVKYTQFYLTIIMYFLFGMFIGYIIYKIKCKKTLTK